jgi:hypothetical protein
VRVDLLVTEGQNEYVLEVNTLPGMTATSLFPKIAAHAGFTFPALCEAIVDRACLHTAVPGLGAEQGTARPAESFDDDGAESAFAATAAQAPSPELAHVPARSASRARAVGY